MTMQDLIAAVTAEKTVENSLITMINGLTAQLKAALSTSDLATVDTIVSQIQANTAAMQAAVTANTPAAPTSSSTSPSQTSSVSSNSPASQPVQSPSDTAKAS